MRIGNSSITSHSAAMTQDLFRQEAVEFSTQRLYGQVMVLPKISHLLMLVVLVLCIALLTAALLLGVHVDKQTITGSLFTQSRSQFASAELYLPKTMVGALRTQQHITISLVGFAANVVGPIDAQVENIGANLRLARLSSNAALGASTGMASGMVYLPVSVSINESALRAAGLPLTLNAELPIVSDIVVSKQSWLRWLIDSIAARALKS